MRVFADCVRGQSRLRAGPRPGHERDARSSPLGLHHGVEFRKLRTSHPGAEPPRVSAAPRERPSLTAGQFGDLLRRGTHHVTRRSSPPVADAVQRALHDAATRATLAPRSPAPNPGASSWDRRPLDPYADPDRRLRVIDPSGRLQFTRDLVPEAMTPPAWPRHRVMVGVDGSPSSIDALRLAAAP